MNGQKLSAILLFVAAFSNPLHAQETASTRKRTADSPSPDQRFAFLAVQQPGQEPQNAYDLIEKDSGKVLLRVAKSDEGISRLDTQVLWAADSKRFALCATYNHLGKELSLYQRTGDSFREIHLPDLPEASIPDRLKPGHHEWKWMEMNAQQARRWQKDGSLVIKIESTLQAVNSPLSLVSERTAVLKFAPSGTTKILKSAQQVTVHKARE